MLKISEPASHFTIERSALQLRLISFLHIWSYAASLLNDLWIYYKALLFSLITLSWYLQYRACKVSNTHLRYTSSIGWAISSNEKSFETIKIKPSSVVGNMLIILHYQTEKSCKTLVIFKDTMTTIAHRRLQVLLKITALSQDR